MNKDKIDPILGKKVNDHLTALGVQTPIIENNLSETQKIDIIQEKMVDIFNALGLDLTDDSLSETPKRIAKMFVKEIYWALDYEKFPKCTTIENKMGYDEMVFERDIKVMSECEHHLRPIMGKANVAYFPKEKVIGLSKINRIVDYFARRPQVQERLAEQIYHALSYILETDDVAVVIDAQHFCVIQRGAEDVSSHTVTSKLGGRFRTTPEVRSEFLSFIR